ncbi:MAG: tetratricopeptide repeat protein [Methylococcales bacterium]|nr:tetratricopeptide repeat protein [Methylococcales bacterium]
MIRVIHRNIPALRLPDLYLGKLRRMTDQELHRLLGGNQKDAAIWVRMAASQGVTEAQLRLGRMLLAGDGLKQNRTEAFFWFERAAASGDADALNMLGRCYENGWGVAASPSLAFEHFRRSAQRGHDWAQYNLGHCYLDGNGVARNPLQAFICYRQAAMQGHGRAMNLLARCYEEGWGVIANPETAHAWYRKSAEAGYFRGQYNWASILRDAGELDEAANWFLQAARNGNQNIRRIIASVLMTSSHAGFKAGSLMVLESCCEQGEAMDFFRYGQALLLGVAGDPNPEKAAYWLQRANESGWEAKPRSHPHSE